MTNKTWVYSDTGEYYIGEFDTKEKAIEEAMQGFTNDQRFIWIGQNQEASSYGVNIDSILEQVHEQAYDEAGEAAENYLDDVTKEHEEILEQRMNQVLSDWMKEFKYEPNFWKVVSTERVHYKKI